MQIKRLKSGLLDVRVYDSRESMGRAAADDVSGCIRSMLEEKTEVRILFAAAPSQNEFLTALAGEPGIEWGRVHALHMDEYVGLPASSPQGFGNFLRAALFDRVPFGRVDYIGSEGDPEEACARYGKILEEGSLDIVCLGIGENGHIAFNDPHAADFEDPKRIKEVKLDGRCRLQQVHDGCFGRLEEVPEYALTVTIPEMMRSGYMYCIVPGKSKAEAVRDTVFGPVSERCPASILRKHPHAVLYTDPDSAMYLQSSDDIK